jgi:Flp pilus assembly protein TadD
MTNVNTCMGGLLPSYDRALAIKPDKDEAWNNRGIVLGNLGRNEEAINSYDKQSIRN